MQTARLCQAQPHGPCLLGSPYPLPADEAYCISRLASSRQPTLYAHRFSPAWLECWSAARRRLQRRARSGKQIGLELGSAAAET